MSSGRTGPPRGEEAEVRREAAREAPGAKTCRQETTAAVDLDVLRRISVPLIGTPHAVPL